MGGTGTGPYKYLKFWRFDHEEGRVPVMLFEPITLQKEGSDRDEE